jgi:hypothetical protein
MSKKVNGVVTVKAWLYSQDRTARKDSQNGNGWTGQTGLACQERKNSTAARTGESGQELGQEPEQDRQEKTARTGLAGQDNRIDLPGKDKFFKTEKSGEIISIQVEGDFFY